MQRPARELSRHHADRHRSYESITHAPLVDTKVTIVNTGVCTHTHTDGNTAPYLWQKDTNTVLAHFFHLVVTVLEESLGSKDSVSAKTPDN